MFRKKKQVEEQEPENKVEEQEEEIIDKNVPSPQVAVDYIRNMCRDWILSLYNLSKQDKHDLITCINYLQEYITKPEPDVKIAEYLEELMRDGGLQNYNKTYEDSGYEVSLTIKKVK